MGVHFKLHAPRNSTYILFSLSLLFLSFTTWNLGNNRGDVTELREHLCSWLDHCVDGWSNSDEQDKKIKQETPPWPVREREKTHLGRRRVVFLFRRLRPHGSDVLPQWRVLEEDAEGRGGSAAGQTAPRLLYREEME
jgi:hypothetical protein